MRDVLVHCSEFRAFGPAARYAAELAAALGAALTGIHVGAPVPASAPPGMPPSLLAEYVAYAQDENQSAVRAGVRFADWARQFGVRSAHWQVALGDARDALCAAGHWSDLLVLERRNGSREDRGLIGEVLLSGAACAVVPETTYAIGRLERIAIACNGSAGSIRALHASLPMLRQAAHVILLEGRWSDHDIEPVGCLPPFDPSEHLRAHGIAAEVEPIDADGEAGDVLLEAASRNRVDLLVAGVEGKRRFDECYLDPTPRHLLRHAALPLFLKH